MPDGQSDGSDEMGDRPAKKPQERQGRSTGRAARVEGNLRICGPPQAAGGAVWLQGAVAAA